MEELTHRGTYARRDIHVKGEPIDTHPEGAIHGLTYEMDTHDTEGTYTRRNIHTEGHVDGREDTRRG